MKNFHLQGGKGRCNERFIGGHISFCPPRILIGAKHRTLLSSILIGADRTYISTLELGNKIASVYCLYKLSQALEADLKDLFNFNI